MRNRPFFLTLASLASAVTIGGTACGPAPAPLADDGLARIVVAPGDPLSCGAAGQTSAELLERCGTPDAVDAKTYESTETWTWLRADAPPACAVLQDGVVVSYAEECRG